jgi:hypothetical protein
MGKCIVQMRFRDGLILLLATAAALFVIASTPAKKKVVDKNKIATRIHFSGNMEGELDPCG